MMREFIGKKTFSGSYSEDLDNTLSVFETMDEIFNITDEEKRKAIPIMLKGDDLSLFLQKAKRTSNYVQGVELLRTWYKYK